MEINATKLRIAETALELFALRGYESAGVNEIVEVAGVTKPALYYHFQSKEGLLAFLLETEGGRLLALTGEAADYRHDLVMSLTALFERTIDFARNNSRFYRLLVRLFASAPQTPGYAAGHELRLKLLKQYTTLFHAAARDHGNMKNRETIYAETFWGLIETTARLVINGELSLNSQTQYRIIHQYMHGIFS